MLNGYIPVSLADFAILPFTQKQMLRPAMLTRIRLARNELIKWADAQTNADQSVGPGFRSICKCDSLSHVAGLPRM